ncbi:MAG: glycosyltransferase family 4 protein [Hydrotalea sp.]|nr:glycosyltransferase family 4 protein [Hydrotalea sp.]
MKILVSNPSKQYTIQLIHALQQLGHEVHFFTAIWQYQNPPYWQKIVSVIPGIKNQFSKKSAHEIEDEIIITSWPGILYKFFGRIILYFDVERWSYWEDRIHDRMATKWIRKLQPNLFIGYEKSCLFSFRVAKKMGIHTLLDCSQVHPNFIAKLRTDFPFFKPITGSEKLFAAISTTKKLEYQLADQIGTLSDFAKQTFLDNGIATDKIGVVHISYNPNLFYRKSNTNSIQKGTRKFIYVGAVMYRKGIADLLQALFDDKTDFEFQLTIVGPGGDATSLLDQYIQKHSNIIYHSFLGHEALCNILQEQELLLLPSYLDSWAVVVPEAMACGVPALVSTHTGAAELITNNENGWIIEPGQPSQIRKQLLHFHQNIHTLPSWRSGAIEAASLYSSKRYQEEVNQLLQHYV